MRKNLNFAFLIVLFFWNMFFFISLVPHNSFSQSSNKGISEENNKSTEPNIEEDLPESVWQPIENSLNYIFSKERSKVVKNGTSIVKYDVIRKMETITIRKDIEAKNYNISNFISRIKERKLPIGSLSSETIFPPDDRQRITNTDEYPWTSITKLYITAEDDTKWIGSGAIIDEFHVLTAGHNVYLHDNGGWASSVEVIAGMDGSYEPFGSAMVTDMRSYTGWTQDEMSEHDWAVLTLDTKLGDYTGWLGRQTASPSSSIYTGTLHTAGYPGDLDYGENMYYTSGNGDSADEYNHWYWLDTAAGQSGSPIWTDDGSNRYIVSIFAYSYEDVDWPNFGTRLNQDKFDQISIWLNEDSSNPLSDLRDRGVEYSGFSPHQLSFNSSTIDIFNEIENIGFISAGTFEVSFYLSMDSTVTTNDLLLGTDIITSLDVDIYIESTWSGPLPASIQDGNYYVGWIIDPSNNIDEFSENNNKQIIETETVFVDRTAPSSTIFYTPKSETNKIDKNTKISLNAYDTFGGSGVNITYYQIDNGGMGEYFEEFTLAQYGLGSHKIYYWSIDNLQNIEVVNIEVVIKLDLSDSQIAIRVGAVMGVVVMEIVVYLFVVKHYLGLRNLTKFNKRRRSEDYSI
ncbi:MAG: Extracellular metalloprotease [Candidatus Anoxychlamydiales bacterium]|nr:Extracellular metalloprotease [Candidatus Anoxychlamydiales bacterium]